MRQVMDTDIFSIIIHPMMFYLASMTFSKKVYGLKIFNITTCISEYLSTYHTRLNSFKLFSVLIQKQPKNTNRKPAKFMETEELVGHYKGTEDGPVGLFTLFAFLAMCY